ncbi:uncharacterized protein BKA78DRAFT_59493 [Phyllosticta capitalensis]|uniref:uncharacterized protein n=1 Tax=Phyllosticta capitalensis TaxID=121624 RepID=UPI00312E720E
MEHGQRTASEAGECHTPSTSSRQSVRQCLSSSLPSTVRHDNLPHAESASPTMSLKRASITNETLTRVSKESHNQRAALEAGERQHRFKKEWRREQAARAARGKRFGMKAQEYHLEFSEWKKQAQQTRVIQGARDSRAAAAEETRRRFKKEWRQEQAARAAREKKFGIEARDYHLQFIEWTKQVR